jgi:hypothetical protein
MIKIICILTDTGHSSKIASCKSYDREALHLLMLVSFKTPTSNCLSPKVHRFPRQPAVTKLICRKAHTAHILKTSYRYAPPRSLSLSATSAVCERQWGGRAHVIAFVRGILLRPSVHPSRAIQSIKGHSSIVIEGGQSQGLSSSTFYSLQYVPFTITPCHVHVWYTRCLSNCFEESI